ncbi:MAG TPA: hypothetical protein VF101_07695 [Gaiellaceae bacterium]
MPRRLLLLFCIASIVTSLAAASVPRSASAACAWNIGCEFHSPQEGHTALQFTQYPDEIVEASWDTYSSFLAIATTSGGTWKDQATVYNSPNNYRFFIFTDKYGCYNHHTGTMWVNCKHYE